MTWNVRVMAAREVFGPKWAEKRPGIADELYVVTTGEGKRERLRIGPPTPANLEAAERKAAQLRQLLSKGGEVQTKLAAPTLREATDDYLKRAPRRLAPMTVRQRRQQLNTLCKTLGGTRIDRITAEQLTSWWSDYVEGAGRSVRTGKGCLEALAQVLADAQFHGAKGVSFAAIDEARRHVRKRNSRTKLSRVKRDTSLDVAPLTPDEAAALGHALRDCQDHDLRLFAVIGMDCGLRLGELLALTWGDFDGERLRIHRSLDAAGKVGPTKTGTERTVQVSRRARQMLKARRLEVGVAGRATSRMLRLKDRVAYRKRLTKLASAAGITAAVKPTTLRHTFGSVLVMNGVPISYIAAQLGHADPGVTTKHYARWIPSEGWAKPPELAEGDVPADLLAGLAYTVPTSAYTGSKGK